VQLIGNKGPALGQVNVVLDGVAQTPVQLTNSTNLWQQTLWQQSNLPCALHTVTIAAATSPGGITGLIFDAFDYGRETCAH
jgi:hypothetical protein